MNIEAGDQVLIGNNISQKEYRGKSGVVTHVYWGVHDDIKHYIVIFSNGKKAVFEDEDIVSASPQKR